MPPATSSAWPSCGAPSASFVDQWRTSPAYAEKAERLKRDLLGRAEFASLAQGVWDSLTCFLEQDAVSPNSVLGPHLENLLVGIGRQLGEDPALRAEINRGMVVVLQAFIEGQKKGVSIFIADQVKSWDMDELIALIEINIGKDLQYIRFNGALIGGLAGLALHSVGVLLAPR